MEAFSSPQQFPPVGPAPVPGCERKVPKVRVASPELLRYSFLQSAGAVVGFV
jgi:hypothetical protein